MTNQELKELDLKYIWHPCSQMKDYEHLPLIPIKRAEGVFLEDFENNKYIDAISSWWVNLFGHNNPIINQAIKEQLNSLEHVIFAGFTHKPAIDLATNILNITAKNLQKVFFADNGSSAVEIALKMAFQYFKNQNQIRDKFISLKNSYHGETLGALAVGDVELYKNIYEEIIIKTIQAKSPALVSEDEALENMKNILKTNKDKVCAIIIEPLVQCAGNMAMYNKSYIKELKKIAKEENVLLIADEIAVGFGRTGEMFVCDDEIEPDFLCLSKGLTGGYLPLALVLTTNKIYSEFYCDYQEGKSFLHSHSYTANPLACAAANATLEIFKTQNIIEKNKALIKTFSDLLKRFEDLENVTNIRQRGLIGAFDLKNYDPLKRQNLYIYKYALKHGVLLRPLANTVYFMPPYVTTTKQLEKIIDVAYNAVKTIPK